MPQQSPAFQQCLANIDVVIFAGGLGTRIRSALGDTPKALALIGTQPFLNIVLAWLSGRGAKRIVLSLGVGATAIQKHLSEVQFANLDLVCLVEPEPLGTAGALRFVRSQLRSDSVIAMNGDSFVDVDLCKLLDHHVHTHSEISMVCSPVEKAGRYGLVEIENGAVTSFREKNPAAGAGTINAGIYVLSQTMLDRVAAGKGPSLERDFLGNLPPGTIGAFQTTGIFLDIGTPESLLQAPQILAPFMSR